MTKITVDLIKLIEQAVPQIVGSGDFLLLQQWLECNSGVVKPITFDLAAVLIEDELETIAPVPHSLQRRINDVTTFGDKSELHIHVLAPPDNQEDGATTAYYGLLDAISNI